MLVSVMIMMEVHTTHTWHHALPWCMLFIKSYFLCLSKVWTINYVFTWRCPCKMLVLLTITRVVWRGGCWATLWSTYYHLPLPGQTIRQPGQSASTITGTGRNLTTQLSQITMTQCLSMQRWVTSSLQVPVFPCCMGGKEALWLPPWIVQCFIKVFTTWINWLNLVIRFIIIFNIPKKTWPTKKSTIWRGTPMQIIGMIH